VPTSWRIVKTRHLDNAFDGEGARLYGARWNSAGTRVVYTAETRALAALELLVHLQATSALQSYSLVPVRFTSNLVMSLDRGALPPDWRSYPPPRALQTIGDDWCRSHRSAVLKVPSAVVADEHNYLINPAHPRFGEITIGAAEPFAFDNRLFKQ